jgi:hypothetical protein
VIFLTTSRQSARPDPRRRAAARTPATAHTRERASERHDRIGPAPRPERDRVGDQALVSDQAEADECFLRQARFYVKRRSLFGRFEPEVDGDRGSL